MHFRFCRADGGFDVRRIVSVDIGNHIPAVGRETHWRVVAKPALDFAVDRNTVVVVKRNQLAQSQRAGKRTRFVRNALHQAAIAQKNIGVVIDDIDPIVIEGARHFALGDRHADRIGESLAQRPGSRFHAGRDAVFRMPGRL